MSSPHISPMVANTAPDFVPLRLLAGALSRGARGVYPSHEIGPSRGAREGFTLLWNNFHRSTASWGSVLPFRLRANLLIGMMGLPPALTRRKGSTEPQLFSGVGCCSLNALVPVRRVPDSHKSGLSRGAREAWRNARTSFSGTARFQQAVKACVFAVIGLIGLPPVNALAAGTGELPPYQRVSGVSGNLSSVGSDTLAGLMTLWTETFKKAYPDVKVQVQAAGSSTVPPALIQGTSNFGPMSRAMKESELQAFENEHGYSPLGIRVAVDALAIYVHKDNPLNSISIEQTDAVFSATRRCGGSHDIRTWGELGLDGSWATRPIKLFGRNSVSGTYGYFKTAALCSGDFKNNVSEQPGSASVVRAVASSLNGIGYSGIGYDTSGVRAVAVSSLGDRRAVSASFANAVNRSYPLARYLYIYVHKRPGESLPPLETEFLRLVLSRDGQRIVRKDGYIPLPVAVAERERNKLL